ncbi:MAG: protein phosphatase 2C domain-containing protein [Planctomycetes bacterium]|nr:protein phosphatase 2C domain-containing protein [Planctomycetota bacterium]
MRSARLFRAEWRIDGPRRDGHPAQDVHDGMRLILDLLVGRLAGAEPVGDDELLAHLAQLGPEVPVDLLAVAVRALDPDPQRRIDGGQGLWLELERAKATHKVRTEMTPRPGGSVRLGFDTHIGALKARLGQTNQDAVFFHQHGPVSLLLVADGISICSAGTGNLASALLVQAVANRWEEGAAQLPTPTSRRSASSCARPWRPAMTRSARPPAPVARRPEPTHPHGHHRGRRRDAGRPGLDRQPR